MARSDSPPENEVVMSLTPGAHGVNMDTTAVGVADAADRPSRRVQPELAQTADGAGHQALATGLCRWDWDGRRTPPCGRVQRGEQPGHDQVRVDHCDTAFEGGASGGGSASA